MRLLLRLFIALCILIFHMPCGYAHEYLRPGSSAKNPVDIEEAFYLNSGAMSSSYSITGAHYEFPSVTISAYSRKTWDFETMFMYATPVPDKIIDKSIKAIELLCQEADGLMKSVTKKALGWYRESRHGAVSTIALQGNLHDIYGIGIKDVVGISDRLINREIINPLAFLHEIMHAYLNSMDKQGSSFLLDQMKDELSPGRRKWLVSRKSTNNTHDILRAFFRENFTQQDRYLSQLISDIQRKQASIDNGELFVLGNRYIEIGYLFPILDALEEVIANIDDPKAGEFSGLSMSNYQADAYSGGTQNNHYPGDNLNIYIYSDSGKLAANIKISPLRKSDGITYDKEGVFITWFAIEDNWLKGKGCGTAMYKALADFLSGLGYSRMYGVPKDYLAENFWLKSPMAWTRSNADIYIPSKPFEYYSEKPDAYAHYQPTVANLHEGRLLRSSSAGHSNVFQSKNNSLTMKLHKKTELLIAQAA